MFTIPAAGWYCVEASWPSTQTPPLALTNGSCQISYTNNGTITTKTYSFDQTLPDTGIWDGQYTWHNLTPQAISISSGTATATGTVTLNVPSDDSRINCSVIASGMRLVRNDVSFKSIDRSLSEANKNRSVPPADVTAHVSVQVNIPE